MRAGFGCDKQDNILYLLICKRERGKEHGRINTGIKEEPSLRGTLRKECGRDRDRDGLGAEAEKQGRYHFCGSAGPLRHFAAYIRGGGLRQRGFCESGEDAQRVCDRGDRHGGEARRRSE